MRYTILVLLLAAFAILPAYGQNPKAKSSPPADRQQVIRSTEAYAEILVRKTELESELESLLVDYTDEFPKVKTLRFEAGLLKLDVDRLLAIDPAHAGRLTGALGRLMVKRATLKTDLEDLLKQYKDGHPDVQRARRKVAIYDAAIKDILG